MTVTLQSSPEEVTVRRSDKITPTAPLPSTPSATPEGTAPPLDAESLQSHQGIVPTAPDMQIWTVS